MSGKLKVVHVIGRLCVGGAQESVLQLVSRLDRTQYDPLVVALDDGAESAMREDFRRSGVRVETVPVPHRWGPVGLWRLAGFLAREKADIVHTHLRRANTPGRVAAILAGVPVRIAHYRSMSRLSRRGSRLVERWLAAASARVVAVSDAVAEQLQTEIGIDPWRIAVIPNAVDLERFRPAERSPARAALGILASDFVVGFAGRLQAVKNLPVLARAAAAAAREVPDLRLLIVGDGEERGKIEALIAELGLANRVSFLGMRRDLPAIYPAMDVFCLPSRAEGCSRVLLEAAACALPLVATPVGSAPELVGRAEEAGLLVPVDDAAALAGALVRLYRSAETRQVMAAAARKRAERWGLAEHVRKIEQLYTELWEVHAR